MECVSKSRGVLVVVNLIMRLCSTGTSNRAPVCVASAPTTVDHWASLNRSLGCGNPRLDSHRYGFVRERFANCRMKYVSTSEFRVSSAVKTLGHMVPS
jgi:hypothetical protein